MNLTQWLKSKTLPMKKTIGSWFAKEKEKPPGLGYRPYKKGAVETMAQLFGVREREAEIKKPIKTISSLFKPKREEPILRFEVGAGLEPLQKKAAEEKIEMMVKESILKPKLTLGEWLKPTPKVRARDVIREIPGATMKVGKGIAGFLKTVQEEIMRSGASVGLTSLAAGVEYLGQTIAGLSPEEAKEEANKIRNFEISDNPTAVMIFGKEPLKAIETRIAEAEIRTREFGRKYKIKPIEKGALPLSVLGVGMVIGLDFTGWGGGKKQVTKLLAKTNKVDDVVRILKKINVADDLISTYSKIIAKLSKVDDVTKALDRIVDIQKTTKVAKEIRPPSLEKLGLKVKPPKITKPEPILLKARLKAEARGAKVGIAQYKREQKFLDSLKKEITIELAKPKGKQRSKIAFIKKLGEFKQTVLSDIKKELGIEKSIKEMNLEELGSFVGKMKERLSFKMARGFRPEIDKIVKTAPKITEEMYRANRALKEVKPSKIKAIKEAIKEPKKEVENILGVISTRLENIDISLKRAIRRLEWNIRKNTQSQLKIAEDFLKKTKPHKGFLGKAKGMSKADWYDFDLALKNGNAGKITELTKKYGIVEDYSKVKNVLDDLWHRAKEVGYDIGYLEDYHPRIIKDPEGFLEYIMKRDDWSNFDRAIKEREMILGRALDISERAHLVNTAIRGYGPGNIALSKTASMKGRVLDFIDPKLNRFYMDSDKALTSYITQVNDAIEARKFFGKHLKLGGIIDGQKIDEGALNIGDSIGAYVSDLLMKGKITVAQEKELTSILRARFNPGQVGKTVGAFKNLSYISVMGSPYNAITQIGDLGFSLYSGGVWRTAKGLPKIVFNKADIKKANIYISRIATEFSDSSKGANAVNKVFKWIGLEKIDAIGKESLINSTIKRLQHQAKNPEKYKNFMKELTDVFGKETDDIIRDLQRGNITENVKYLAFNKLLDFQPIALSEVPEQYLKSGNGKVFYMLKTWTIKMLDVYRRESIQKMAHKETFWKGFQNFLKLTASLVAMEATADEIKDFVLGREEMDLSDRVVESTLKLFGASRWERREMAEKGIAYRAVSEILPPTNVIDDVWKDLGKVWNNPEECFDVNDMRSVQSIPFGGKLYYWWFGKASQYKEESKVPSRIIPKGMMPEMPSLKMEDLMKTKMPSLKMWK